MSSIQGQILEVAVIGCRNLIDTEWISRQDPYVVVEYAGTRYRTRTDTDGGKNPSFNDKFTITLNDFQRDINVNVWNSNTLSADDFIGSGKILLQKVLSTGFDDNSWPLTSRKGKRAGDVRIIMHYTNPNAVKFLVLELFKRHDALPHNMPFPVAPHGSLPSHQAGYGYPPPYAQYPPTTGPWYGPGASYDGRSTHLPHAYSPGMYPPQQLPYSPPHFSETYPPPEGYPYYNAGGGYPR